MEHFILPNPNSEVKYLLIVEDGFFRKDSLTQTIVRDVSEDLGIEVGCIAIKSPPNRTKVADLRLHFDNLIPGLRQLGIKHILCASPTYWKAFNNKNVRTQVGTMVKKEEFKIFPIGGYLDKNSSLDLQDSYKRAIATFCDGARGKDISLDQDVRKPAISTYHTVQTISGVLDYLLSKPTLAVDLETYSLDFTMSGIATISFSPSPNESHVIACLHPTMDDYGRYARVLTLLSSFFHNYTGKLIFHNSPYDMKIILYQFFMDGLGDYANVVRGIRHFHGRIYDTQLMAYVLRNSTIKNNLSLEHLVLGEFGNYSSDVDVKNVDKTPLHKLMEYNGIDTAATFWLYEDQLPKIKDQGLMDVYLNLMQLFQSVLIQAELVGMPVDVDVVSKSNAELSAEVEANEAIIRSSQYHDEACLIQQQINLEKRNAKLVNKKTLADIPIVPLLLTSPDQLAVLFHEAMGLPIVNTTKTGKPATGADDVEIFLNYSDVSDDKKEIISAYLEYSKIKKIVSTFIPALSKAKRNKHGYSLHGSFNDTGTISGRLSSSNP